MTFQTALLNDIGKYLNDAGFGVYATGRTYTAADNNPIYWDSLGAFDKSTALTLYPVDTTLGSLARIGLQVRVRGRPGNRADIKNLTDAADDALHGLQRVTWGGADIILVELAGGGNLGEDSNRRQDATRNYYITYTRATAHRSD